eukprot:TRINITY_DN2338_c6_g1_i1.p1 TRINITY_DN2338_c6_g1~~TRINITY_DN2338_c6_g1_i1.p1  ORF type:complete len:428 (-),score=44.48 TRINITY_DN2338_c6_g1_i1:116-1330(-)
MKLHYFDTPGKGEPIRLLFIHAQIPFEDHRVRIADWPETKSVFENHQLPMLEIEGKKYYQSYAILEYLGIKYGYLPTDPEKAYHVISIMNVLDDFSQKIFNAFSPFTPYPEELTKSMKLNVSKHDMILFLAFIENRLVQNESPYFLVGDSYTLADFCALGLYANLKLYPELFTKFLASQSMPLLKAYFLARLKDFPAYYEEIPTAPKLYYFDIPGRGEMIRLLLKKANVQFEDVRIKFEEWPKMKEKFALKQLPVLVVNGIQFPETDAIMRYLSIQYGYLPLDPDELYKASFVTDTIKDLVNNYIRFAFAELPEDKKAKLAEQYYSETVPLIFSILEKRLKENESTGFFVGNKYTIADFYVLGAAKWLILNPMTEGKLSKHLDSFPTLKEYIDNRLKDYQLIYS